MIRYGARPSAGRERFEARAAEHVDRLSELVDGDLEPDLPAIAAYIEANSAWESGVKPFYMEHQGRTCAYCERKITDHGDAEHFRPKTAVFALDIGALGDELPSVNNVRGRVFRRAPEPGCHESGYWWLAYDWDNLFVACGICNRIWKNAVFPVASGHPAAPTPESLVEEEPLLLDPYGDEEPARHLAFNAFGAVEPFDGSVKGRATIDTLGLDRPSVTSSRVEKAARATLTLGKVAAALDRGQEDEVGAQLADLVQLGTRGYAHAGMVRCMAVQALGLSWEQIVELAAEV